MKCSKCNSENIENSKFCIICGESLDENKQINPVFDGKCKICKGSISDTKHQENLLGVIGEVLCVHCADTIYTINNTTNRKEYNEKTCYAMAILNSDETDEECRAILLGEINWDRFADGTTDTNDFWSENLVEKFSNNIRNEIEYGKINEIKQAGKQAVSSFKGIKDKIEDNMPNDMLGSAKQASYNFKDGVSGALNSVNGKSGWYRVVKFVGYLLLVFSTVVGGVLGYGSQRASSFLDSGGDETLGMIVGAGIGFVLGVILLCIVMMFAEMAANISNAVDLLSSINEKLDKNE